ncbi:MAG: hypothetical protein ACAI43_00895, partial [Phycisphaerae bacterium]|nr:hypothetical protein [Tepidisphaeraceae bacterium]
TDQFFAPAVDEENKRGGQNPPNWHVSIATREKQAATRFLTVIEVAPGKKLVDTPARLEAEGEGRVRLKLGDYDVTAELDPAKPSFLGATHKDGTASLVSGQAGGGISLGGDRRAAQHAGSTMLWERPPGASEVFIEEVDRLPDVLLYGNRY